MSANPIPYPFSRPGPLAVPKELGTIREAPVQRVILPSGDEAYLVTRYDDVKSVLTDPRVSRNLNRPDAPRVSKNNMMFQDSKMDPDPPEHTRVRRLVMKAFTATRVERLRPRVQEITDELIEAMAAKTPPVNVSEELAFPLSIRVICDLLGVPPEEQGRFRRWTDHFLSTGKYTREEIHGALGELNAYMSTLIEEKRERPADDLVSALIQVHDEDDTRLSEYELHWWCRLLLLVGYETTASQLGLTVAKLLAEPGQVQALRADESLLPGAVEELLRWKLMSGSLSMLRYVTEDIEVGGVTIPKGSGVIPAVESANWDEKVFHRPDDLDITRADNPHLTFSVGPHFCVGAALARVELETALGTLLRRFATLRLAIPPEELRRTEGTLIESLVEIPITW
ncbi:cytochrome P450 [Nonomuraea sp. KC401]|uniref:cytochrome P450 n=1 Tax=unclassified Nonomuraea TaxID=2593643 RepID=UPI0010FE56CD|nr:cytochrome P450 [Nonomuraea sp. KC401]NBE93709.1 cytochrome P450 [Nonomuraea sp. K271]TLF76975.1 cytochrome P450 [Nonomuraea sp. KC401]